jgi:regulator of RNase E activity RraA
VTNGSVTDWAHLSQLTLPTFARGTSPLTTRALSLEGEINTPITIEGCAVTPGDLIIGDDDGLFVIPPHRAEALASAAEEKQAQEHEKRRVLRAKHPAWFC